MYIFTDNPLESNICIQTHFSEHNLCPQITSQFTVSKVKHLPQIRNHTESGVYFKRYQVPKQKAEQKDTWKTLKTPLVNTYTYVI